MPQLEDTIHVMSGECCFFGCGYRDHRVCESGQLEFVFEHRPVFHLRNVFAAQFPPADFSQSGHRLCVVDYDSPSEPVRVGANDHVHHTHVVGPADDNGIVVAAAVFEKLFQLGRTHSGHDFDTARNVPVDAGPAFVQFRQRIKGHEIPPVEETCQDRVRTGIAGTQRGVWCAVVDEKNPGFVSIRGASPCDIQIGSNETLSETLFMFSHEDLSVAFLEVYGVFCRRRACELVMQDDGIRVEDNP